MFGSRLTSRNEWNVDLLMKCKPVVELCKAISLYFVCVCVGGGRILSVVHRPLYLFIPLSACQFLCLLNSELTGVYFYIQYLFVRISVSARVSQ